MSIVASNALAVPENKDNDNLVRRDPSGSRDKSRTASTAQLFDELNPNSDVKINIELAENNANHPPELPSERASESYFEDEKKELLSLHEDAKSSFGGSSFGGPAKGGDNRPRIFSRNNLHERDDGVSLKYVPILSQTPPDFVASGEYGLRYKEHIRIFLVITMYNEGREELDRTLKGVGENLKFLQEKTGVKDFWKEVVICIVSDGRTKANEDTLDYMTEKGFCSREMMTEGLKHYKDEVACHLFEATVQLQVAETLTDYFPPMQIMFALKEKNAGKINSHWWFYMAFAEVMKPTYCFLLDVGTTPRAKSFYYMFKAMERNDRIAGVAGEITTINQWNLSNPIVAAQQFEYKMSSIFDKTMESCFGYITVLPGAFSAYRWKALAGEPMKMYFHHLVTQLKDQEPFLANMYLAEDRILCYELVAKKGCNYTLHYVKEATATTDVPTDIPSLIKQRRRWLNGSLFALIYALLGWKKMMQHSSHSIIRKLGLTFEYLYFAIMVVLQWTAIANYYLTFYFLVRELNDSTWFALLRYLFLALLLVQFVLGLGNKPGKIAWAYNLSAFIYGLFTIAILAISIYEIVTGGLGFLVKISLIGTFGSLVLIGVIHRAILALLASFAQYTFLTAMYVIMFPIYSLCNVHDISWGTKNLDESKLGSNAESLIKQNVSNEAMMAKFKHLQRQAAEDSKIREQVQGNFEQFRSILLLLWMFTNGAYVSVMTSFADNDDVTEGYLTAVFILCMCFIGVRSIGSVIYLIVDTLVSLKPVAVPKYPTNLRVAPPA
jgi:chitin synthase